MIFTERDHKKLLVTLSQLDFNYDAAVYESSKEKGGWNIDHHQEIVGHEPPGPPVPKGPFEKIKEAIRLYHFPNPKLISAVFDPEQELKGRNMLQVAHFMGFTFQFGVRVTDVIDKRLVNTQGQTEEKWGYSYRTLKGHFEIGQITFITTKNHTTGEIFFSIDAYSKPDRIPNLFYRLGFQLFGRSLQRYFVRDSYDRLRKLVQQ